MSESGVSTSNPVCPESTIESANRRHFIKKAAIATAAAGIGGTILAKDLVPESSASSNACGSFCSVYVDPCGHNVGDIHYAIRLGGVACASGEGIGSNRASNCKGNQFGLDFYTAYAKRMSITQSGNVGIGTDNPCAPLCVRTCSRVAISGNGGIAGTGVSGISHCGYGVYGLSNCGYGIYGCSCSGTGVIGFSSKTGVEGVARGGVGVRGSAFCAGTIPIVAQGTSSQTADLQQWGKGCLGGSLTILSVVDASGNIGIGTSSPSHPLEVHSASSSVTSKFKSQASSGDRSAIVQFENGDTSVVDWNIGVSGSSNPSSIPDGTFYFQRQGLTNVPIAINKCGYVGINNDNPVRRLCITGRIQASCGVGVGTQTINTTLAVNGSIAAKIRSVAASTTLSASDFGILASGNTTLTLPPANTQTGMMLFVKKTDSSSTAVNIAAGKGDSIETLPSKSIKAQFSSLTLISNGAHEWFILSGACGTSVVS